MKEYPVIIARIGGGFIVRWFLTKSLVRQLLANAREDDDVLFVDLDGFGRLEISVHDDRKAADRAFEKLGDQLRFALRPTGGSA